MAGASRMRWVRRSLRRSTHLMAPGRWKPRLVFWTAALAIGVLSVCFAWAADAAHDWFEAMTAAPGPRRFVPLVLTPLGFLACAILASRFFPGF